MIITVPVVAMHMGKDVCNGCSADVVRCGFAVVAKSTFHSSFANPA